MNLGRVKSFLIFLFLAINIYLVVSLALSSEFRIDDTTIDNTVAILKKSDITVKKDIIPKKAVNLTNIETVNVIHTDRFKKSENADKFKISGDSFSCVLKDSGLYNQKDSKIVKYIKSFLEEAGFDSGYMEFSAVTKSDNTKKLTVNCTVKDYSVFDSRIIAEITASACTLSGIWYEPRTSSVISNSRTRNTVYITSILIDIAENTDFKAKKITNIEFGYLSGSLYGNTGHLTATALPYYRLTDENKNVYYYDAADGTYNNSVSKSD